MSYLEYLLKSAILLTFLFGIYQVFLRRSQRFLFNRLFLLSSCILSLLLPFVSINLTTSNEIVHYINIPQEILSNTVIPVNKAGFGYQELITWGMAGTSFLMLSILMFHLFRLIRIVYNGNKIRTGNIVLIETSHLEAFSFFHFVFLGKSLGQDTRNIILKHEMIHVKNYHSVDNMISEILLVIQWFNPVAWFMKKELVKNHEYEADSAIINEGIPVKLYHDLLINQLFGTHNLTFSSFNHNLFIKSRIKMMTQMNHTPAKTRLLPAIMLSIFVISVFSFKADIVQIQENIAQIGLPEELKKDTGKIRKQDVPFTVVDQPATFRGNGLEEFSKYVLENMKYPKEAIMRNMQGKVYIQFVVEKNGTVQEAKVMRGVGLIIDEEAIRVVKSSPAWVPAKKDGKNVRQLFTLPIVFKLQE